MFIIIELLYYVHHIKYKQCYFLNVKKIFLKSHLLLIYLLQIYTFVLFQMMSAIKAGHISHSRFARMAELEEEAHKNVKNKITVERSGGGL